MDRMPPTTEPLSRNLLDETFVWILADEKERQALRTHSSPGTCYGRSTSIPLRAPGFDMRKHRLQIRIGSL
jgi:hypothetical protein